MNNLPPTPACPADGFSLAGSRGAKKDLLTENDYGITRNIIDKIKEQYYDPVH